MSVATVNVYVIHSRNGTATKLLLFHVSKYLPQKKIVIYKLYHDIELIIAYF